MLKPDKEYNPWNELTLLEYTIDADIPPKGDIFHEYKGPSKSQIRKNYRSLLNYLSKEGEFRSEQNFWNGINHKKNSRTYFFRSGLIENTITDDFYEAKHAVTIVGFEDDAKKISDIINQECRMHLNNYKMNKNSILINNISLVSYCSIEELKNISKIQNDLK